MDSMVLTLGNIEASGVNITTSGDGKINLQLDATPAVVVADPDTANGTVTVKSVNTDNSSWLGSEITLKYDLVVPGSSGVTNTVSPPAIGDVGLAVAGRYFIPYTKRSGGNSYTATELTDGTIKVQDSSSIPVTIKTGAGNYYPLEKGSISNNDGVWSIDPAPYMAYDNVSEFTGTWVIYMAGGGISESTVNPDTPSVIVKKPEKFIAPTDESGTRKVLEHTMTSGSYLYQDKDDRLNSLQLTINKDSNDSIICFNTHSDDFEYTISIDNSGGETFYLAYGVPNLEVGKSYIIAVDNNTVGWRQLDLYE